MKILIEKRYEFSVAWFEWFEKPFLDGLSYVYDLLAKSSKKNIYLKIVFELFQNLI